jgi:hypothetical protein
MIGVQDFDFVGYENSDCRCVLVEIKENQGEQCVLHHEPDDRQEPFQFAEVVRDFGRLFHIEPSFADILRNIQIIRITLNYSLMMFTIELIHVPFR